MTQFAFEDLDVSIMFLVLADKLRVAQLRTEHQGMRYALATEFMLMHKDDQGRVGFKHRCTRNYVFLVPDDTHPYGFRLQIPEEQTAFMRGYFDLLY